MASGGSSKYCIKVYPRALPAIVKLTIKVWIKSCDLRRFFDLKPKTPYPNFLFRHSPFAMFGFDEVMDHKDDIDHRQKEDEHHVVPVLNVAAVLNASFGLIETK
jgi:hypothetical protein